MADDSLRKLNTAQQEAVDAIEGPVMVIAGPGTGKTEIIARRIAKILEDTQLDPRNILCLTFTESGVVAMRRRLLEIISEAAYRVKIHTFHSFCNEVIQNHPEKFPDIAVGSDVISDVERFGLMESIISELEFDSPLKPYGKPSLYLRSVLDQIGKLKQEGISPKDYKLSLTKQDEFLEATGSSFLSLKDVNWRKLTTSHFADFLKDISEGKNAKYQLVRLLKAMIDKALKEYELDGDGKLLTKLRREIVNIFKNATKEKTLNKQKAMHNIYISYQAKLRESGKYDYEDMILMAVERFESDEQLLRDYQEQFQYILVDEYQDTNTAQNRTLKLLGNFFPNPNIFVVGDDDQSIYRFQGASLENLIFFYDEYKDHAQFITLEENYRSGQTLLSAADDIITCDRYRAVDYIPGIEKKLVPGTKIKSEKVRVARAHSESEEGYFIAQEIGKLITSGTPPEEIAIIYRNNRDADDLADKLHHENIPYVVERGEDILGNRIIRNIISVLSYLVDPVDELSLFKILGFDLFGTSGLDLAKLLKYSREHKISLLQLITSDQVMQLGLTNSDSIALAADKIEKLAKLIHNEKASVFLVKLVDELELIAATAGEADGFEALSAMHTLKKLLVELEYDSEDYTIANFLDHLQLMQEYNLRLPELKLGHSKGKVRLMTAHRSKGLEFDHVFITRANEKRWEKKRSVALLKLPFGLTTHDLEVDRESEERRLFYVALTRAKKSVYITYAEQDDKGKDQLPTLFAEEIDKQHRASTLIEFDRDEQQKLITSALTDSKLTVTSAGREYLSGLIESFKLNVTAMQSYMRCPRCFLYQKLLKIPGHKNKHMILGTSVHAALNELTVSFNQSKKLPSKSQLLDFFHRSLDREVMRDRDYRDTKAKGEILLSKYYDENEGRFPLGSLTEYNFYKHNVLIGEVPITGIIDRVDFIDKDQIKVNLVDYKTGNPDTKAGMLDPEKEGDYYTQILFYKLLVERSSWVNWSVSEGKVDFIEQSSKSEQFVDRVYSLSGMRTSWLEDNIKEVYSKIKGLEFSECGDECDKESLHELEWNL
ncbi:MAG: ATP-dependent helicase [Candidatus Dojkabacteria bacterium]